MYKLLLMSVLFAPAVIPALQARDAKPKRGLKRAVGGMLLFNVVYMLAVIFVYPHICW